MKIDSGDYRVAPDTKVKLDDWPTDVKQLYDSKEDYAEFLEHNVEKLSDIQNKLYADGRWSLLIIFQALDAAGKDGAISHVMSGLNPQGCQVFSFKQPGPEDLAHDFLWRTTICLPERGRIGIFNRSYYEEVLVVKVHPAILEAQKLPEDIVKDPDLWEDRYRSIVDFERHLHHNGTRVIKFFLHLSEDEQRKRFLARLEDPDKNWKFSQADITERGFWDDYMRAYEACLSATSTAHSPWFVVPADDKKNARMVVSQVILDTLKDLKLSYPKPSVTSEQQFEAFERQLKK